MISLEAWVDIKSMIRQGRSIRQISRTTGLSRNTVRRYLREDDPPRYAPRPKRPSILDPYKDYLTARLEAVPELDATVLLREIQARGYPGAITTLKDFIRPLRAERLRLAELTVRYETAPGEQGQVDWAEFGRLPDGRKLYALVVVLGWSRASYVHFTTRMTLQELLFSLVLAFESFGGFPKKLLFDNLKSVVLERRTSVAESTLHPRFLDFAGHYGLQVQLCEPARPRTKGKVERPVDYVRRSLVRPNFARWTSAEDANRDARHWLGHVANVRLHGTTRERPCDRLPKEGLTPLSSARPYDLRWSEVRQVYRDCHFSWSGNRYSVPWQHGATAVLVRRHPDGRLEVERGGEVIATHRERPAGRGETLTRPEHIAGLWQKTLGRKQAHPAPVEVAALLPLPHTASAALPALEVEQRELAAYQFFLDAAAAPPALLEVAG